MENMLKKIGFTRIEHYKSSTENYPDCLSKATIDILENNLDSPILIVEDDIEWTGIDSIEYDSTCDAIYLGISRSGGHPTLNIAQDDSKYEIWSTHNVRVMNMLSAHAILYVSRSYKEAVITILRAHLGVKYYNDVLMSRIQANYLVLATKKPVFYQSVLFGNDIHVQNFTRFVIE